MSPKRVGDMELEEDLRLEAGTWRAERVGWLLLGALLLLSLIGVFGEGPLSTSQGRSLDGSAVADFERFARRGGSTDLHDILEAARRLRGLERLDQIKQAVLERDGQLTIVPKERRLT